MVVDSASLQHSFLEMDCLLVLAGTLVTWRDPTRQLKPGTVAPRCGEDSW